jgi:hypothetical protein
VLRADAFRTFVFVALAAAGLWAYTKGKLKAQYALAVWVVLIFADMWPMNKKYLNNDDFISQHKMENPFTASAADNEILKDKGYYRVLNISERINPFSDASTSYFHKSIGGYHGAKLQRYQELISNHIAPEIQSLNRRLQNVKTQADLEQVFAGLNAINMLNTQYIILQSNQRPLYNRRAMGNAWFVNKILMVENADEEIEKLDEINIATTALVDKRYSSLLPNTLSADTTAGIALTSYAPNRLEYVANTSSSQLAIFSDIYYPKGWKATINGNPAEHFHVNYVLRGMIVPEGKSDIVFYFEPDSYFMGNKVSFVSSILLLLAVAAVIFIEYKKRKIVQSNE